MAITLPYPVPTNEIERLQIIEQLQILDTPQEPHFDALVRTAARLFNVPISLCSIVHADRQWFKARFGFDLDHTPREHAFCSYPVASGQILVVEDATLDARFATNPMVRQENGIRFYAGAPLSLGDGHFVGTLCVIDTKPRLFSVSDRTALADLAEAANSHLTRRTKDILADTLGKIAQQQTQELKRQHDTLQAQMRILDQAARFAKLGGFEVDLGSGELRWTEGMYAIHGLPPGTPISHGDHYLMYSEPDRSIVKAAVAKARARAGTFDVEARATTADGRRRWFRIAGGYAHQAGQAPRWCGMKQDITDQKRTRRRVEFLAGHDPVTRLANRNKLQSMLDRRFNDDPTSVALILVDLDNFKLINDIHGHPVGDACLKAVARLLRRAARGRSLVARMGGDEFAILPLVPASLPTLMRTAERLLASFVKPIELGGLSFHISASIGVACGTAKSTTEIMRQADVALYASKAAGRKTCRAYTAAMDESVQVKYNQISTISDAIIARKIEIFYQPKIDLSTNQRVGFEALVRCRKDDGSIMTPASFAAALDDAVVSARLGEVVLGQVIEQASDWERRGVKAGHVAVNLSASQLTDPEIVKRIVRRLDSYGLSRNVLEVEITENVLLSKDPDQIGRILEEFRTNGIRVSLDDFGTGYASLTHLRQFKIDALKIDRSFVSRIGRVTEDTLIVQAIVSMAHSLGIEVIAEGIETSVELELLRALKCQFGQGYLFGRPQPAIVWDENMHADRMARIA